MEGSGLNGKEVQKEGGGCMYTCVADSPCCTVETNTSCKATMLR